MAESRRFALTPQLDIKQIIGEAQQRWLRPAEICEILRNYRQFRISPEPPNKPPSGSLFLFDRKVLRYFRKDGHNWRKKKDGKTVKEAHERLKAGSVDVLHCYYAHGEGNENFQRRSYWMLEEDFMHIVFVHYLEVKSSKASYIRNREAEVNAQVSPTDSPATSSSFTNQSHLPSQITDAGSPISTQTSEYEDAESDNYQTSSRYNSVFEMQQYGDGPLTDIGLFNPYATIPSPNDQYDNQTQQTAKPESDLYSVAQEDVTRVYDQTGLGVTLTGPTTQFGLTSWQEVLEHCSTEFQSAPFDPIIASTRDATFDYPKQDSSALLEYFRNDLSFDQDNIANAQGKSFLQPDNMKAGSSLATNLDEENSISVEGNHAYASLLKQLSLDHFNKGEGLKKHDSFSRWMSTELGEVDDSHLKPTSEVDWSTIEGEGVTEMSSQDQETYLVSPSISQEQRFSIIDFSPNWVYTTLTTKVIINGTFLKNKEDVKKYRWSCMFGEVEVPADIIAEGTLSCHAPPHKSGRVPFYITCSDRLACSEVREFEYRQHDAQYMETIDSYNTRVKQMDLHIRLEKLLSLSSVEDPKSASIITVDGQNLMREINLLIMEVDDEWFNISKPMHEQAFSSYNTQDYLLQRLLKDKLHAWLLDKVVEDGKGPNVLDEEGQGVLHLAAALGYDWAIKPTIVSGVSVNFRDARGWTALHWAAFCGRERTVATLIGLDASPGLLTDPTFDCPTGRTPADLASASGHKGIAGFLAESSLTSHLRTLTLKDSEGRSCLANVSDMIGVEDVAERTAIQSFDGDDIQGGLSLKDSLSAVRNAAQAAARIHQVFRVESFHRKKLTEYGDDKCGISDERALSLVSLKAAKGGQHDLPVHAAAVRIQNKFRGWKGRKEFLVIRQRIVKIQAHVRGHQVRKHYKKIVWTVGIVEKAILRWRRRRSGLRGFKSEGLIEGPSVLHQPPKEDDYDFLKEGRKQTEVRLEKALARVKSMVQYPEARDQYRRLLNVVKELQEPKDGAMNDVEDVGDGDCDFMTGLEELGDDDSFMPALWQG